MELDLVSPENLLLQIAHTFATQPEVYRTIGEDRFSWRQRTRLPKGEAREGVEDGAGALDSPYICG
jgi:hypothetical protein